MLNLLPIPGLDGYGAIEPHLSAETQRSLAPAKQFGFLILLIVLIAREPKREVEQIASFVQASLR